MTLYYSRGTSSYGSLKVQSRTENIQVKSPTHFNIINTQTKKLSQEYNGWNKQNQTLDARPVGDL